jgi:hypothetical protein
MRLIVAMETILGLAVGLALARAEYACPTVARGPFVYQGLALTEAVDLAAGGVLTGIAVVGAVGIGIESACRRSPSVWGWGRSAFFVVGIYIIMSLCLRLMFHAAADIASFGRPSAGDFLADRLFADWSMHWTTLAPIVVAVLLAHFAARRPRADAPDVREWFGRVLAVLFVISSIARDLLVAFGR